MIVQITANSQPSVVWRREWTNNFISPWGVFERFMFANSTSMKDVLLLFGTDAAQKRPRIKEYQNLFTLKAFNNQKFINLLGEDITELSSKFASRFILPLNQGDYTEIFIRKTLAFCPECLAMGYHSILHLYMLLDKCPFHNTKLITNCTKCSRDIPMGINLSRKAFHCSCGAPLINNLQLDFTSTWSDSNKLKILDEEIKRWLSLSTDDVMEITQKYYMVPEACIKNGLRVIRSLIEIQKNERETAIESNDNALNKCIPDLPDMKYYKSEYFYYLKRHQKEDAIELFNRSIRKHLTYYQYMRVNLKPVYKSIVRQIRKRILFEHKICIKEYKKDSIKVRLKIIDTVRTICPYAKAYIKWRKELEGISDEWMIDAIEYHSHQEGLRVDKVYYAPLFESRELLSTIGNESERVTNTENWPRSFWVISHLYAHFLMKRFNYWLNITKRNRDYIWSPLFIIEFCKTKKKNQIIKFHFL